MKRVLWVFVLLIINKCWAQQIEVGPNIGYGFSNIANSAIVKGRAVIGNALWNSNSGFSLMYFFKDPDKKFASAIHVQYIQQRKGSKSEVLSGSEYNFQTSTFNVCIRPAGNIGNHWRLYADFGIGFNTIENAPYYSGTPDIWAAFPTLETPLSIKKSEVTFVYGFGIEKPFFKNSFVCFASLTGDAGITTINESPGRFRTQSLGFGTGVRYILHLTKQPDRSNKSL